MSNSTQQNGSITSQTLLDSPRRWHLAVPLKVAEGFGERFQPTGFPNLGAALYKASNYTKDKDGKITGETVSDFLLTESAQSLANWMEHLCLDPQNPCRYNSDCSGIPYVIVQETVNGDTDTDLTSSLTEPHRLASDEILGATSNGSTFATVLTQLLGVNKQRPVHLPRIAKRLFYIDPACLLHGIFLEKLDGRIRFSRLLSATITAKHPAPVNAGGVMRGYITIEGKEASIPYGTQHFTSPEITLHLTFHTDSLRDLGLDPNENHFLAAFALYKINKLLRSFPRLRTACVFDSDSQQNNEANLPAAIQTAFTTERRNTALGVANTNLPRPLTPGQSQEQARQSEQPPNESQQPRGFTPFVIVHSSPAAQQAPAQAQPAGQATDDQQGSSLGT
jgi:CRISPR-associated protein Csb1